MTILEDIVKLFEECGLDHVIMNKDSPESQQSQIKLKHSANLLQQKKCSLLRSLTTTLFNQRLKWNKDDSSLYNILNNSHISPSAIAKTLFIITENESSYSALLASTCYFSLLQVPGAFLYQIFDALIVTSATNVLKKWLFLVGDSRPKRKLKKGDSDHKNILEGEEMDLEFDAENDENLASMMSTSGDDRRLEDASPQEFMMAMKSVESMAEKVFLRAKSESFMSVLDLALDASRLTSLKLNASKQPKGKGQVDEDVRDTIQQVVKVATNILDALSSPLHGSNDAGFRVISKSLMSNILMTFCPVFTTTIPKEIQNIRKLSLNFLVSHAQQHPNNHFLQNSISLLMQYICIEVPERAEYRHSAADSIQFIFNAIWKLSIPAPPKEEDRDLDDVDEKQDGSMNEDQLQEANQNQTKKGSTKKATKQGNYITHGAISHFQKFLSFISIYIRHKKPQYRLFALEVIEEVFFSKIPIFEFQNEIISMSSSHSNIPLTVDQFKDCLEELWRSCVERSLDKIPTTRAKACQLLSAILDATYQRLSELSNSNNQEEDIFVKSIRQVLIEGEVAATISKIDLKETDESETSIAENQDPDMKEKETCKSEQKKMKVWLVEAVKRRWLEERSTVRKSALQLCESILKLCICSKSSNSSSNPSSQESQQFKIDLSPNSILQLYQILKESCFDPLMIIRKQGSISLTRLVSIQAEVDGLQSNDFEKFFEFWLSAVPFLLFDPESSIQEQTLKSIYSFIMEPILSTVEKKCIQLGKNSKAWQRFFQMASNSSDSDSKCMNKLFLSMSAHEDYRKEIKKLTIGIWNYLTSTIEDFARLPSSSVPSSMEISMKQQITQITSQPNPGNVTLWRILSGLSSFEWKAIDIGQLTKFCIELISKKQESISYSLKSQASELETEILKNSLKVLSNITASILTSKNEVNHLDAQMIESLSNLMEELMMKMKKFQLSSELILTCFDIICNSNLIIQSSSSTKFKKLSSKSQVDSTLKFVEQIFEQSETELNRIILTSDKGQAVTPFHGVQALSNLVFQIGHIGQYYENKAAMKHQGRLMTLLQTLIAPSFKGIVLSKSDKSIESLNDDKMDYQNVDMVNNVGQKVSMNLKGQTQLLPISPSLKSIVFVTLGKFCLQDVSLAKSCMAVFAKELENPSTNLRNNLMVIMCDLMVKYSNFVEDYLPRVIMCLNDSNELVRSQTIHMLTWLLQDEFIKLKPNVLLPLFTKLVDSSPQIQIKAFICIESILQKHAASGNSGNSTSSQIYFGHFIDMICFLNDFHINKFSKFYSSVRKTNDPSQISSTTALSPTISSIQKCFNLAGGGQNRQKRFAIYKHFIDHMEDSLKFQVSFRLCEELVQPILDGILPLEDSQSILYDVLCILSSEEMRLKTSSISNIGSVNKEGNSSSNELDLLEPTEQASAVSSQVSVGSSKSNQHQKLAELTGALASQVVKRSIVEKIVPILIDLKVLLAKRHSPLLRNTLNFLIALNKEFPTEMKDVMSYNKQLMMEIEYETKQSEKANYQMMASPGTNVSHGKKQNQQRQSSSKPNFPTLTHLADAGTPWKPKTPLYSASISSIPADPLNISSPSKFASNNTVNSTPNRLKSAEKSNNLFASPSTFKSPSAAALKFTPQKSPKMTGNFHVTNIEDKTDELLANAAQQAIKVEPKLKAAVTANAGTPYKPSPAKPRLQSPVVVNPTDEVFDSVSALNRVGDAKFTSPSTPGRPAASQFTPITPKTSNFMNSGLTPSESATKQTAGRVRVVRFASPLCMASPSINRFRQSNITIHTPSPLNYNPMEDGESGVSQGEEGSGNPSSDKAASQPSNESIGEMIAGFDLDPHPSTSGFTNNKMPLRSSLKRPRSESEGDDFLSFGGGSSETTKSSKQSRITLISKSNRSTTAVEEEEASGECKVQDSPAEPRPSSKRTTKRPKLSEVSTDSSLDIPVSRPKRSRK